jgi:hypothetical protein
MVPDYDPEYYEVEEDPDNLEPATDEDLLAMFRSSRKKKVEDPYVEFEDGVVRANFYNPETLPEDPEEFFDYEAKAVEYFKGLLSKMQKAQIIDDKTARQVVVVLHGGVNYQQDMVMTKEGAITQAVLEQGHEQPYFEVSPQTPVEAAEVIIAGYSVSIARLRGAYMQAKLQELQDYASNQD